MWGSLWRKSHRMGKLQPWPAALNKDGGRRTLLICFFVFLPVSVLVFLEQMVSSAAVTHLGWACVCMREYAVISSWSPSWLSNRSWRGWCVGDREPGHTPHARLQCSCPRVSLPQSCGFSATGAETAKLWYRGCGRIDRPVRHHLGVTEGA